MYIRNQVRTSDVATCESRMYVSGVHAKFVYTSVYIRNSYVATFSYVATYETSYGPTYETQSDVHTKLQLYIYKTQIVASYIGNFMCTCI